MEENKPSISSGLLGETESNVLKLDLRLSDRLEKKVGGVNKKASKQAGIPIYTGCRISHFRFFVF